jgi:hypothetical protein
MKPVDLFDLCVAAVARFNSGEMIADAPMVMLSVPRRDIPKGDYIRLYGRSGPLGRIATIKGRDDGQFDVIGYFPAVPILKSLGVEVQYTGKATAL